MRVRVREDRKIRRRGGGEWRRDGARRPSRAPGGRCRRPRGASSSGIPRARHRAAYALERPRGSIGAGGRRPAVAGAAPGARRRSCSSSSRSRAARAPRRSHLAVPRPHVLSAVTLKSMFADLTVDGRDYHRRWCRRDRFRWPDHYVNHYKGSYEGRRLGSIIAHRPRSGRSSRSLSATSVALLRAGARPRIAEPDSEHRTQRAVYKTRWSRTAPARRSGCPPQGGT